MKRQRAYRFGVDAERIAAWYLRFKGYRIVGERFRNGGGEIDIVAVKGKTLIAIEVKARKTLADCSETVPPRKQQKIGRALEGLLSGNSKIAGLARAHADNIRFDVIWIAPNVWPKHIKDAWRL